MLVILPKKGLVNLFSVQKSKVIPILNLFFRFFDFLQNTIDEWSVIFVIAAIAYIVPAFVFILFGSGQVQPWNESKKTDEKTADDAVPPA